LGIPLHIIMDHPAKLGNSTLLDLIRIYMDGSSLTNTTPKKGGWCYLVEKNHRITQIQSQGFCGTNNEAELRALVESLKFLESCEGDSIVELYTDSSYVLKHLFTFSPKKEKNLILVGTIDSPGGFAPSGILKRSPPNYYPELWDECQELLRKVSLSHTIYLWWLRAHLTKKVAAQHRLLKVHSGHHNTVDIEARRVARNFSFSK